MTVMAKRGTTLAVGWHLPGYHSRSPSTIRPSGMVTGHRPAGPLASVGGADGGIDEAALEVVRYAGPGRVLPGDRVVHVVEADGLARAVVVGFLEGEGRPGEPD